MNSSNPPHAPRLTPFQMHALFRLGQLGAFGAVAGLLWLVGTSQWLALAIAVTLPVSLYLIYRYRPMTPRRWQAIIDDATSRDRPTDGPATA